jgi:hypothetical protein
MRRDVRGGGRGAPATYQSILGPLLVEMWHSQLGIALASGNVDTWTGQIGGRVLQAASAGRRMLYQTDAAFSSGKLFPISVAGSTSGVEGVGLTPFFLSGSRPWIISVFRFDSMTGVAGIPIIVYDTTLGNGGPSLLENAGGNTISGLGAAGIVFSDTASAHTFEQGYAANGQDSVGVDGVYNSAGATGLTIAQDRTAVRIGTNSSALHPTNAAHALHLFCSARPSTQRIVDVTALARAEFGY